MADRLRPDNDLTIRYARSPSRRRRSSTSDHEFARSKVRRTAHHLDVSPYRKDESGSYQFNDIVVQREEDKGPARLCSQCRKINIANILTSQKPISSSRGHFLTYLKWDEVSTCLLCNFLKGMRIPAQPDEGSNSYANDHGYHLRAFSAMSSYREYFFRPPMNQHRPRSGDTMLAVVPNGLFSDKKAFELYSSTFGSTGYILPVAYSSTAPWLTARQIDCNRIDFPTVQGWLHFCKRNHHCTMRYSRPEKLKLIDCKNMKMSFAPPNCNYFALSYVWGEQAKNIAEQSSTASTRSLSDLAAVVQDAIHVVKSLGWRYLWVDKYCIPQNDEILKHEQLRTMDLIYEGAYCTIVAAAGSNDRYGLPGISRPREQQPSVNLGQEVFVSTLRDPQNEIRNSTWMTRAWTYQEALCSARRLVFTDHQVYFECKSMHCCEAVEVPLNLLHTHDRKTLHTWVRSGLFKNDWTQGTHRFGPLSTFWDVVKQYAARDMTKKCDVLNGLAGILRRFQGSPSFVYNIFGMPLYADPKDGKEALLQPRLFIGGLSWSHAGPPRRRICAQTCDCNNNILLTTFPSWTWAGWQGAIESQRVFGNASYETNVQLWVEEKDGHRTPWSQFWNGFWTPEGKTKCLEHFSYLVLEADIFKVQLAMHTRKSSQAETNKHGGQRVDMLNPYSGVKIASVMLPIDLVGSSTVQRDLWDCVVLGSKAKAGGPDVMLIRWNRNVAERVWAGTFPSHRQHNTGFPPVLRRKFRLG
ncbi:heterokaryon incompatibility protein-domain-containing protein [Lophiotrema nucula]|uniref:Heterokaryon incompatibility protein-domain-containing protein n=1 Tax=Lophiotrema nucula TaxID=690887 RepID=A0A6A5ZPT7_9PLEO|nr:heterokaryon incompatibility protein-domain-containing protein [Lophiotrema nucula]